MLSIAHCPSLFFLHSSPSIPVFPSTHPSLRIIELNGGQSPLTYKRFQTLISRMEPVEMPAEVITADVMGACTTPISDDHDDKFGVPSLEELGRHRPLVSRSRFPLSSFLNMNILIFPVQYKYGMKEKSCGIATRITIFCIYNFSCSRLVFPLI